MDTFHYEFRIPKTRIAVIIGKEGTVKKEIEESTKTALKIDSKEGEVFIYGDDALGLYIAREIIKAIGRGFNPDIAKLLLRQDYIFETMQVVDFTGKSRDSLIRLKGRVIGKEGKSRKLIEQLTDTYISVFGKTVSIIGKSENAMFARQAVEYLLKGSTHSSVYQWLERKRAQIKKKEILEL